MGVGVTTVVTLVHGTFAKGAAWTKPGSSLRRRLEQGRGTVEVVVFEWSGQNSHSERVKASSWLARSLNENVQKYPDAKHYIIAHSHGGNVALRALSDLGFRPQVISGLICLGTPYLSAIARKRPIFMDYDAFVLELVLKMMLLILLAPVVYLLESLNANPVVEFGLIVCAFGVLWSWKGPSRYSSMLANAVYRRLTNRQERLLRVMRAKTCSVPLLNVYAAWDEAAGWLRLLGTIGAIPYKIDDKIDEASREVAQFAADAARLGPLISLAYQVFAFMVVASLLTLTGSPALVHAWSKLGQVNTITLVIAAFLIVWALAAPVIVLLFEWARRTRLGFGGEGIFDGLLVKILLSQFPFSHKGRIVNVRVPVGELASSSKWFSLRHSLLYEHGPTVDRVYDFIFQQAAEGAATNSENPIAALTHRLGSTIL
jgi:pimeloyl-ACP methyl ester carboxylesterase